MKKLLVITLSIIMTFTMLSTLSLADSDIQPGDIVTADKLSAGDEIVKGLGEYQYGTDPTSSEVQDISWIILDPEKTNMGTSGMFLISKNLLDNTSFGSSNAYQGSDAQQWCTGFFDNALKDVDYELGNPIIATTKNDAFYTSDGGYSYEASDNILNGDRVFLPSAKEVDADYLWVGSGGNEARKARGADTWWWLRSPNSGSSNSAGDVSNGGRVRNSSISGSEGVRVALNLNPESLFFRSIEEGKYEVLAGVKVTFNTHGGTEIESQTIAKGESVTAPEAPSKEGYTFKGWYTAAEGGSEVDLSSATFDEDTELHAQWEKSVVNANSAKTGDMTETLFVAIAVLSVLSVGGMMFVRKKRR